MLVRSRRSWALPERLATPESIYLDRRRFIAGLAAGGIAASLPGFADEAPPPLYPAKRNEAYTLDRKVTDEKIVESYNNFYEFGMDKSVAEDAQALPVRPWQVKIDGMVEKERLLDIDDLLRRMPIEERLYRHRCVEAWSFAVPWTGFPMKALVALAGPTSGAKYVRMETFMNPDVAPAQGELLYPWPYVEGLTLAEATNELAFLVTGAYGKPVAKQDGAPLRLATPWKYGFKSIKSLVRFSFTDRRPTSFWMRLGPTEYGFWANVNPQVPHPRWSQATERSLGTGERVPTLIYNGYGEQVAGLYADLGSSEKLFM